MLLVGQVAIRRYWADLHGVSPAFDIHFLTLIGRVALVIPPLLERRLFRYACHGGHRGVSRRIEVFTVYRLQELLTFVCHFLINYKLAGRRAFEREFATHYRSQVASLSKLDFGVPAECAVSESCARQLLGYASPLVDFRHFDAHDAVLDVVRQLFLDGEHI